MSVITRVRKKLNSIRRRILLTVSLLYLVSSALSAVWIYYEVSHEVDELFDAELVQQAKTLLTLVASSGVGPSKGLRISSLHAHEYENKLSYRVETGDGQLLIQTDDSINQATINDWNGFTHFDYQGNLWHSFAVTSADGAYRIVVLQGDAFRSELRMDLTIDTVIPVLVLLPFVIWIGWGAINLNFRSFTRLAATLRRKRSDDYEPLVERNDTEEVAVVKAAINHYLYRIEQTFVREKQFSADAAHELRTPLASLKAQLQSQLTGKDPQQDKQISGLLRSTNRLISLVESLLTLSRAGLPPERYVPVNVAGVLRQVLADGFHRAEAKQLKYQVECPETVIWIGDNDYFYMLFANLVDNAIKYSVDNGCLAISFETDSNRFSITNQKDTAHKIEQARLNERFYRGKQLNVEGAGLGLSIVNHLANHLNVTIEFSADETTFSAFIAQQQPPQLSVDE